MICHKNSVVTFRGFAQRGGKSGLDEQLGTPPDVFVTVAREEDILAVP
jgi:hypothetical protein